MNRPDLDVVGGDEDIVHAPYQFREGNVILIRPKSGADERFHLVVISSSWELDPEKGV